jgi:hypothetical protein
MRFSEFNPGPPELLYPFIFIAMLLLFGAIYAIDGIFGTNISGTLIPEKPAPVVVEEPRVPPKVVKDAGTVWKWIVKKAEEVDGE